MKLFPAIAVLVLSLVSADAYCAPETAQPRTWDEVTATVADDGIQRVEIIAGSYFFKPNRIVVKVNVPVELKVRKEKGMAPHNIVVRAPEASVAFSVDLSTEAKTIAFTPSKVGVYPITCDKRFLFFASHREKGMEGILDVRE